ncbi:FGGY-family carbohydrate kinase [Rhizobiales bacterium]|uniref:FGGY-family carbohydrate kinase n=1 Tax=Hongsoonwoonella zoysiae TaxID=2821844 RepID=UPI00155F56C9|nr:FGGY-family carbohydrate kinase [Hongsoonwoonella zoysiae]NRG16265.1 FGGY-family carbohydrate kinase [Hongsoonwoonella zoysiae]
MEGAFVCAVDVGTASARAGIFDAAGNLQGRATREISINRPQAGFGEYDSEEIWASVCSAVKNALMESGLTPGDISAIAFDATCSLVARGREGEQVSISPSGEMTRDTIAWFDHRAIPEADECTATGHRVLDHLGGVMSPEMQTPKLIWLKRNLPQSWEKCGKLFDLADFLTWRATGRDDRSRCTLTSKWTYLSHDSGWQEDFFEKVGLEDLIERGGLPHGTVPVGAAIGTLTAEAAAELGLGPDCRVAAGLIDAFAGSLGVIGGYEDGEIERGLALIAGTSSCVMGFSGSAHFATGIWGPYYEATLPGLWLYEAGQSATGALLDHIIRTHGAGGEPDARMHERIVRRISELRLRSGEDFAANLHVLPDFHGNRSPSGDPHARGVISGLSLDASFDGLCRLYWRTAVSIALGLRHILDHLNDGGMDITYLHVTGGHTKNPLLMELYADATGRTVRESETEDAVLLGTAMAASCAAGMYGSLSEACRNMRRPYRTRVPNGTLRKAYDRDYEIFHLMHRQRSELEKISNKSARTGRLMP